MSATARWPVVLGGFLILMCLGIAYAWGVFLMPIAGEFGWGRGETSLAVSILLLVFSVFMVVGGILEKRYGPKITATLGGVFVALGWILAYFTNSLWWLYATYGVLAGIGTGLGYLPSISAVIKWYPDKKGMISGIVVFGFGFGSAFLAPLAAYFIELYGWKTSMLVFGVGFGAIITLAAQLLKSPPEDFRPPGWVPKEEARVKAAAYDFTPGEMLKTPVFKIMFITYAVAMVAGMMTIGHISAFARDLGFSSLQAAFALTVLAICNGAGRIICGILSDKIGRKEILTLIFGLIGVAMLALYFMRPLPALYAAAGLVGFCFGGFLAVYPPTISDFFGAKHFGTNYGLVFLGYGVGSFAGPWLGGLAYDLTGSYLTAFAAAGALALLGGLLAYSFLKPPKP